MKENREVKGYCIYCKTAVYEEDFYVMRCNNMYHVDCFELIKADSFGVDTDDFTETDC